MDDAVEKAHCEHCGWQGVVTELITSGSDLNEYCPDCGYTWRGGTPDEIFVVPVDFEKHLPPMKSLAPFVFPDNTARETELEAEVAVLRKTLQDIMDKANDALNK